MQTTQTNHYSDKLAWGLTLLAGSLLAELVLSAYGLATLGTSLDTEALASGVGALNPVQILLSCLSPLGFLLKIAAILLIVQDSTRLNSITNGKHRRLALAGLGLFVVSLLAQIGTTVLSFNGTMGGSLQSLQLAMVIGMVASLLSFAIVLALTYYVVPQLSRVLLAAGLVVYIVSTAGASIMTLQSTTLQSYDMMGNTYFVPSMNLDRTQGIYPILAVAGTLAVTLTFAILITAAVNAWRSLTRELPESVA